MSCSCTRSPTPVASDRCATRTTRRTTTSGPRCGRGGSPGHGNTGRATTRTTSSTRRSLTAPRSQPSKRLPGVPQTRCGDVDKVCGPTTNRSVGALELSGDNLAVVVDYDCTGCSGIAQSELRLDKVAAASSRGVALPRRRPERPAVRRPVVPRWTTCVVPGLRGHRRELQERGGAVALQALRAHLRTRCARPDPRSGFADTGSRLYEVLGCNDAEAGPKSNSDLPHRHDGAAVLLGSARTNPLAGTRTPSRALP